MEGYHPHWPRQSLLSPLMLRPSPAQLPPVQPLQLLPAPPERPVPQAQRPLVQRQPAQLVDGAKVLAKMWDYPIGILETIDVIISLFKGVLKVDDENSLTIKKNGPVMRFQKLASNFRKHVLPFL